MDHQTLLELVHDSIASIVTVAVALLLYQGVRRSTRVLVMRGRLSDIMALRLRLVARWVLVLGTLLIVLQQTGVFREAWALLTAVATALAVGFVASWSVLSNATAALLLLVYQPFRVGDEVEIVENDGKVVVKGRVVDLNLFFTTVLGEDSALRVPNNLFVQKYSRVRRAGRAPDPALDSAGPFFTLSPGGRWLGRAHAPSVRPPSEDKSASG
jgi:small-conductance mechanosensitive channel